MLKAKIILFLYKHIPVAIKNHPAVSGYLIKIADRQIVKLQKELIQKRWLLVKLQNEHQ